MLKRLGLLVGVVAFVLMAGSSALAEQAADVTGTWAFSMTLPNGNTMSGTLLLEQDGEELKGTFTREGQDQEQEVTGKIEESAVTFSFARGGGRGRRGGRGGGGGGGGGGRGGRGGFQLSFEGTVDGDAMSGTANFGRGEAEWTAERTE